LFQSCPKTDLQLFVYFSVYMDVKIHRGLFQDNLNTFHSEYLYPALDGDNFYLRFLHYNSMYYKNYLVKRMGRPWPLALFPLSVKSI
jgi:hypothetical protein